jgi:hypothetical protein
MSGTSKSMRDASMAETSAALGPLTRTSLPLRRLRPHPKEGAMILIDQLLDVRRD